MIPIQLKSHQRPLTCVKFNREGDLLFSAGKDPVASVYWSSNGERIGTFNGHNGAIWSIDVDYNSKHVLTASADMTVKLWEAQTGVCVHTFEHKTTVRWAALNEGDTRFVSVTDQVMGMPSTFAIFKHSYDKDELTNEPLLTFPHKNPKSRVFNAYWSNLNESIICCSDDGHITAYDPERGEVQMEANDTQKNKATVSINFNESKSLFVAASKDHHARLYDARTLKCIKTYDTHRPCNAAVISPLHDHVILGGGQSAADVTSTRLDSAQFRLRFFHSVYEQELGSISGHFGPVNTLAMHPSGKGFVSGGEDGFIRLNWLDDSYIKNAIPFHANF